jgi:colanic acid/amylovoran biosynthesis protein
MTEIVVDIQGVWLPNKGAELMARAAVRELGRRLPGARFTSPAQGPEAARAALGMPARPACSPGKARLLRLVGAGPRHTHVVDISGFGYGDYWGPRKAKQRAGASVRAGLPTYLLPQAFGPFTDPALVAEMRRIVAGARFVGARDRASLEHLRSLGVSRELRAHPDITIGIDASDRAIERPAGPYACLVPNAMTVRSKALDEDGLLDLYALCARKCREAGVEPIVVLHEPEADEPLARRLVERAGAMRIAALDDALDIKALLAGARCIATARFHGLVGGLSSGVPSLAVGWSHKYEELLADFDCPELLYAGDAPAFAGRMEAILRPGGATEPSTRIRAAARRHKAALSSMWDEVAEDILRTSR